jgi:HAD superfamily hydrolase (TIGR01490 family)
VKALLNRVIRGAPLFLGAALPAAYFDVDGTLVGTNLIHPTVMYLANQASPLDSAKRIGRALLQAPAMWMAEKRDRRLFNEMLFSHYKGMTEDRLITLSEEVYDGVVKSRIFKGAEQLIHQCQDAGLRVVLITGSLDYTIKPLAEFLGIQDIICNRLEMKDGYATGKLLRPVVAGPEKARIIAEDARRNGDDLAQCHAYSDSYSDVPMLSVVGHPNCINPDEKLERLAKAYDWPILDIFSSGRRDGDAPYSRKDRSE